MSTVALVYTIHAILDAVGKKFSASNTQSKSYKYINKKRIYEEAVKEQWVLKCKTKRQDMQ